MRFKIAKPDNWMSFGDLFYTQPNEEAESHAFAELEKLCREKAEKRLEKRVSHELVAIKTSNNATGVLIMREIADLSREMGYPTALFGMESGLYIMEILGISNIHTDDYENSKISSDICIAEMLFGKSFNFTLAIAEPIREKIRRCLLSEFGYIECNDEIYRNINLPRWDVLEKIGDLSAFSGEPYDQIPYNSPKLLEELFNDICKNDLKKNACLKKGYIPIELARLYAFARYHNDEVLFSDVRNYVLRDDVFKVLKDSGAVTPEALRLSENSNGGIRKMDDIDLLKQYDLSENFFYCYNNLRCLWPAAPCLSRVNALATLLYYKNEFRDIYNQLIHE